MKTKLVYVIVSSDKDIYLEQAYVSMASAKHFMPDAKITLLTDKLTASTFVGNRKKELKYVDELITIDMDAATSGMYRSRLLKTGIRNYIDGDFLFIDSDTIIVKPLNEIDLVEADISACLDIHSILPQNPYRKGIYQKAQKLGVDFHCEKDFFNSGVIFVRDTPASRDFYKKWQENYIEGTKLGIFFDQPSFAKTNIEMNHMIMLLPDVWNCQIRHGIRYLKDAFVIHYLCTNVTTDSRQLFILNERSVLEEVKQKAEIPASLRAVFDDPFLGISPLTTSCSGYDVDLLLTRQFGFLRSRYGKLDFRIFGYCLDVVEEIKSFFRKL